MERMWKSTFVKWLLPGAHSVVTEYSRNLRCLKDLVIIKRDGYFSVVFYINILTDIVGSATLHVIYPTVRIDQTHRPWIGHCHKWDLIVTSRTVLVMPFSICPNRTNQFFGMYVVTVLVIGRGWIFFQCTIINIVSLTFMLNASVILERNKMGLERNEKCLGRNETLLTRNETRGGNLILSGTVISNPEQVHEAKATVTYTY